MDALQRHRAQRRDAHLARLDRYTRRTAYAGLALAGVFAAAAAAALPGHTTQSSTSHDQPPRTSTPQPRTSRPSRGDHALQPPPAPPAPAASPPMSVSGSS